MVQVRIETYSGLEIVSFKMTEKDYENAYKRLEEIVNAQGYRLSESEIDD